MITVSFGATAEKEVKGTCLMTTESFLNAESFLTTDPSPPPPPAQAARALIAISANETRMELDIPISCSVEVTLLKTGAADRP